MTGLRGRVRERLCAQENFGFAKELALEAAQLRREVRRLSSSPSSAARPGPYPEPPDVP